MAIMADVAVDWPELQIGARQIRRIVADAKRTHGAGETRKRPGRPKLAGESGRGAMP